MFCYEALLLCADKAVNDIRYVVNRLKQLEKQQRPRWLRGLWVPTDITIDMLLDSEQ